MHLLPPSEFVEFREGGHFIVGTRISVDSIAYGVLRGQTVEEIHDEFPALASREKLERVIAFVKEHPLEIKAYLAGKAEMWEDARRRNSPEITAKLERYRAERKSA